MANPLKQLTQSIGAFLISQLKIKTVITPGGIDTERQPSNELLTIGWNRLNNVSEVATGLYRVNSVSIDLTLKIKDLKLKDIASDIIYDAAILLTGYQPYTLFDPLIVSSINCDEYDSDTGFLTYSASFITGFEWMKGKPPILKPIDVNLPTTYEIVIKLWNSPTLSNTNQVLIYDSTTDT